MCCGAEPKRTASLSRYVILLNKMSLMLSAINQRRGQKEMHVSLIDLFYIGVDAVSYLNIEYRPSGCAFSCVGPGRDKLQERQESDTIIAANNGDADVIASHRIASHHR